MTENGLPSSLGGTRKNVERSPVPKTENPVQANLNRAQNQKKLSELEQIKQLEEKQTNYVFLFGDKVVGKSTMVASMLNRISSDPDFEVEVLRSENNSAGTRYVLDFRDALKSKKFPNRTANEETFQLDVIFYKRDSNGQRLGGTPLTFIDISGENLNKVSIKGDGKFPDLVDIYFKADRIPMLFLLVTTPAKATEHDSLFNEFLDYIVSKDPKFRDSNICLVVTQYDRYKEYTNGLSIEKFVKERMPLSYGRFLSKRNGFTYFSVGDVQDVKDENGISQPQIRRINEQFPLQLFEWIYETMRGEKLYPLTFLERISKIFQF
jgi:GTP-binding protein EngB required for normal cell division